MNDEQRAKLAGNPHVKSFGPAITIHAIPSTAIGTYTGRYSDVLIELDRIKTQLSAHADRAKADPTNWGHAGDLGHVLELLREVVHFTGRINVGAAVVWKPTGECGKVTDKGRAGIRVLWDDGTDAVYLYTQTAHVQKAPAAR